MPGEGVNLSEHFDFSIDLRNDTSRLDPLNNVFIEKK